MADNGLKRYSVQESNNVTLGQLGFDELSASTTYPAFGDYAGPWIAIKAIGNSCNFTATSSIGDDLGNTDLSAGDIVYGAFTGIVTGAFTVSGKLIAYRG
jgi:hypothetical protein